MAALMRPQVHGHMDLPQCRRHHVSGLALLLCHLQVVVTVLPHIVSWSRRLNKYILDPKMGGFPFPLTLTGVHMVFCSTVSWGLVRLGMVDAPQMPVNTYIRYAWCLPNLAD
eukprot:GHUV01031721.1.p1 GENE.GHUV01031721.1~~GHUV01031721.1.p1  ORF type:complete len:112 (+),score=10.12 GHUV01031721.1:667-1002(+)